MIVRYRIRYFDILNFIKDPIEFLCIILLFYSCTYIKNYFCLSRIPTALNLLFKNVCKFSIICFSPDLYTEKAMASHSSTLA